MSFIRLIKRTAKMSDNTLKFITTFLSFGKINAINPKINPINAIAKSTAAKIVNAVILFNFLIVNNTPPLWDALRLNSFYTREVEFLYFCFKIGFKIEFTYIALFALILWLNLPLFIALINSALILIIVFIIIGIVCYIHFVILF